MVGTRLPIFLLFAAFAIAQHPARNISANSSAAAEPGLPVVDLNACPFEGCTFGKWKVTKNSTVYSSWQDGRTELARLSPGDEVTGLTGVHVTRRPDRILVKEAIPRLGLKRGDILLCHTYEGEGFSDI